jgi:hypothetical protein
MANTKEVFRRLEVLASIAPRMLEEMQTLVDMARKCELCDGTGQDPLFRAPEACKRCGGVGELLDAGCELGSIRDLIAKAEGK